MVFRFKPNQSCSTKLTEIPFRLRFLDSSMSSKYMTFCKLKIQFPYRQPVLRWIVQSLPISLANLLLCEWKKKKKLEKRKASVLSYGRAAYNNPNSTINTLGLRNVFILLHSHWCDLIKLTPGKTFEFVSQFNTPNNLRCCYKLITTLYTPDTKVFIIRFFTLPRYAITVKEYEWLNSCGHRSESKAVRTYLLFTILRLPSTLMPKGANL